MTHYIYRVESDRPLTLFPGGSQTPTIIPAISGTGMVKRDFQQTVSDGFTSVTMELTERVED